LDIAQTHIQPQVAQMNLHLAFSDRTVFWQLLGKHGRHLDSPAIRHLTLITGSRRRSHLEDIEWAP